MIVAVPDDTPVTIPVDPAVANAVLLLLQVPPLVTSLSEVVRPAQTVLLPEMAVGNALIVTAVVDWQPVGNK